MKLITNYIKQTDRWLLLFCIITSLTSIILLAALKYSDLITGKFVFVQALATIIGILSAVFVSKIDYHILAKLWKWHTVLAYVLLVSTLFIGISVGGNKAWIEIPFTKLTIQPSEFLKISFIVTLAWHMSNIKGNINQIHHLIPVLVHGSIPVLLIHFLQGDDGTAMIFVFIFLIMLFSAGISWKYIVSGIAALGLFLPILWIFVLNNTQKSRIIGLFNPSEYGQTIMFQQNNVAMSIGSGGIWGRGLFTGTHRNIYAIQSDMIFGFIGEALGFIGCMVVILLLFAICCKILLTAQNARDDLGKYISIGIFGMIATQVIINLGMSMSLLPVIGITLPFISYGGTSVLSLYLSIGVALGVHIGSKKNL
ncbi:MAG: FtsW/RodA/SpoVE family cell cycle protein, partial [Oscillospiraceae bacterium]